MSISIYLHIPFCERKCGYCDFYSITALDLMPRFGRALKQEMTLAAAEPLRFDTLYIGGGTPSLLKAAQISEIIDTVQLSKDLGLNVTCFFMLGHYADTRESIENTIAFCQELKNRHGVDVIGRMNTPFP